MVLAASLSNQEIGRSSVVRSISIRIYIMLQELGKQIDYVPGIEGILFLYLRLEEARPMVSATIHGLRSSRQQKREKLLNLEGKG